MRAVTALVRGFQALLEIFLWSIVAKYKCVDHTRKRCLEFTAVTMTTPTEEEREGLSLLVPEAQPPPTATGPAATASPGATTCTSSSYERHPLCTQVAQPCETVTQETGPHSPSELVTAPRQPPPAIIYGLSRDAVDGPPPAQPLRCCCACSMCPCISITCMIASPDTAAMEGSRRHNHTSSSQLYLQWTTVPVQESLSGYEGPSVLAC